MMCTSINIACGRVTSPCRCVCPEVVVGSEWTLISTSARALWEYGAERITRIHADSARTYVRATKKLLWHQ